MKKTVALLLLLTMLLAVLPVNGANPLIFTAINDVFQLNPSPNNMPLKIGGTVYVAPETFTRVLELKTIYNSTLNQYLVYNTDMHLVFDLQNNMTFDESSKVYSATATRVNGKVYVPASLVCQKFGFKYAYITLSSLGDVVRINSDESYSNDTFIERNAELMRNIHLTYTNSYSGTPVQPDPDTPSPPDVDDPEANDPVEVRSKRTSLLFQVTDLQEGAHLLQQLKSYGLRATFFFSKELALEGDFLRRAAIDGHSIGIAPTQKGGVAEADEINNIIKGQTLAKTSLVLLPGNKLNADLSNAFVQSGYKAWSGTFSANGSAARIVSTTKSHLKGRTTSSRLIFDTSPWTVTALDTLLPFFRANEYTIARLLTTDKPK